MHSATQRLAIGAVVIALLGACASLPGTLAIDPLADGSFRAVAGQAGDSQARWRALYQGADDHCRQRQLQMVGQHEHDERSSADAGAQPRLVLVFRCEPEGQR